MEINQIKSVGSAVTTNNTIRDLWVTFGFYSENSHKLINGANLRCICSDGNCTLIYFLFEITRTTLILCIQIFCHSVSYMDAAHLELLMCVLTECGLRASLADPLNRVRVKKLFYSSNRHLILLLGTVGS